MFSSVRSAFKISQCKSLFEKSSFRIRKKSVLQLCTVNRNFHGNFRSNLNGIPVKELSIPIPFGHLSAKAWGHETGHPTLALHGWMNNCGTFDKLIPLLDRSMYIVALDFPGHGMSSHKPPGCLYTHLDMIIAIQYTKQFLGWNYHNLIGHSMGGEIAQLYSALYPEHVNKLVLLDGAKPASYAVRDMPELFLKAVEESMVAGKKILESLPVYSEEAALDILLKDMHNEITEETGKILLHRGCRLSDCSTGQIFTTDLRVRNMKYNFIINHATLLELLSQVKSEVLIVLPNTINPAFPNKMSETSMLIDLYAQNCKHFSLETVNGNHFVHLNNPECVAPLINKFLLR